VGSPRFAGAHPDEDDLRRLALLADALRGEGLDVRAVPASGEPTEPAMAAIFAEADAYDMIHVVGVGAALGYARLIRTPMLVTVTHTLDEHAADFCRGFVDRVAFVRDGGSAETNGLPVLDHIDLPGSAGEAAASAGRHRGVYAKVLSVRAHEERRPWGYYVVLADEPDHKAKRIVVDPGKRLSLQKHERRTEHWTVVSGRGRVTRDEETIDLGPGGSVVIPQGAAHRIENPDDAPLVFIEVQRGSYFGEDDIIRLADDFGRVR